MWTDTLRAQYARAGLALPSDLTDAKWAVLEPFLPPPSYVGRPRKWPLRRIVEWNRPLLYCLCLSAFSAICERASSRFWNTWPISI